MAALLAIERPEQLLRRALQPLCTALHQLSKPRMALSCRQRSIMATAMSKQGSIFGWLPQHSAVQLQIVCRSSCWPAGLLKAPHLNGDLEVGQRLPQPSARCWARVLACLIIITMIIIIITIMIIIVIIELTKGKAPDNNKMELN